MGTNDGRQRIDRGDGDDYMFVTVSCSRIDVGAVYNYQLSNAQYPNEATFDQNITGWTDHQIRQAIGGLLNIPESQWPKIEVIWD